MTTHCIHPSGFVKRMSWGFFLLVLVSLCWDQLAGYNGNLARGAFVGLALGFLVQVAFYWVSHRQGKLISGGQMFFDMSLAMVVKWGLALVGFAVIFRFGSDFVAPAVLAGFFVMQPLSFFAYLKDLQAKSSKA